MEKEQAFKKICSLIDQYCDYLKEDENFRKLREVALQEEMNIALDEMKRAIGNSILNDDELHAKLTSILSGE